jgi:hypothetical protein
VLAYLSDAHPDRQALNAPGNAESASSLVGDMRARWVAIRGPLYLLYVSHRDNKVREGARQLVAELSNVQHWLGDGLVDRSDYLRQSQRLRSALAIPRGTRLARAEQADGDKRAVLRRALDRVVVLPHPSGRAASHLSWPQRQALLADRLQLHWT